MIAAIIITKNEESNIARCIKSLTFCDELIVVDADSTDSTCMIAAALGAKVTKRSWTGYSDQRNFGLTLTRAEWVLSVDADEEVSPDLRDEILKTVQTDSVCSAFSVPRKTMHSGHWIRWGGWYPNRLVRLFKRDEGKWEGNDVHEFWSTCGKVGLLNADLIHYSFEGIFDQVERNNRYSTFGARALQKQGRHFSMVYLLGKPLSKFFETYILKLGLLDGFPGLIISISAAYSVFLKWAKLWELESKIEA